MCVVLTMSAIRVVDGFRGLVHALSRHLSVSAEVVVVEVARVASVVEPLVVIALPTLWVAEDLVGRGQLSERLVCRVDIIGILTRGRSRFINRNLTCIKNIILRLNGGSMTKDVPRYASTVQCDVPYQDAFSWTGR